MRFEGRLKTWDAQRGFGLIAVKQGGQEILVHASAFPLDRREPTEGEALSFEVEIDPDGKKRAVRVYRPGQGQSSAVRPRRHEERPHPQGHHKSGVTRGLATVAIVAVLGWFAYTRIGPHVQANTLISQAKPALVAPVEVPAGTFLCDGRKYCSQMTSCSEAKYFLKSCPGVKMDGNNDGVPCEKQWCTSPLAK